MRRGVIPLLLAWAPLLPAALPLLLVALLPVVRRPRALGRLALAGLGVASLPLLPWPGLPRVTPLVGGAQASPTAEMLQWSTGTPDRPARAAAALLLLVLTALGLWSIARFHQAAVFRNGSRSFRTDLALQVPFAGLLMAVGGGQLALLALTPIAAVLGVGIAAVGMMVTDLGGARPGEESALAGALPLLLGPSLLGVAAIGAPDTTGTRFFWAAGCVLLLFAVPLRLVLARTPLLFSGAAHALGLSPVAAWLLVPGVFPGVAPASGGFNVLMVMGGVVFAIGSLNTAAAGTLRGVLCGQWFAQLGLVVLTLGIAPAGPGSAAVLIGALFNAVGSTLLLSLMVGRLTHDLGTERIADLPPPRAPLHRCGLAYALGAASAAGLPLTLGYVLRRALDGQMRWLLPLLLGGSTLLLLGLVPPLLAFLRRSVRESGEVPEPDQSTGAGLLLGLLLVLASAYPAWATLVRRLLSIGLHDLTLAGAVLRDAVPEVAGALARLVTVVVLLGIANRALRRARHQLPLAGGLRMEEDPGWSLPWAALQDLLRPFTPAPWLALARRGRRWGAARAAGPLASARLAERRYYLLMVVLITISLVLLAAGERGV